MGGVLNLVCLILGISFLSVRRKVFLKRKIGFIVRRILKFVVLDSGLRNRIKIK